MSNLQWYLPLEQCDTLDGIRSQWQSLLEQHHMTPWHNVPRYQDALLSFLGKAALAPHLKLAATLACGSAFDFDLRLAIGVLGEQVNELDAPWPEAVADAVSPNGPALAVATADPWLAAFVAGRLAGLRETFTHDGVRPDAWCSAFWNKFLEMACRHADVPAVKLALQRGADCRVDSYAAVQSAAQGEHQGDRDASGASMDQAVQSNFERVLRELVAAGLAQGDMLTVGLPAAAAVDNTDMLDFLLAQGADIRADGAPALAAAASNVAYEALAWLLDHGAPVHADGEAALMAAIASLDEGVVEMLLSAGADLQACGERALHTALTSSPYALYAGDADLAGPRADMIALLARHGLASTGAAVMDARPAAAH